ncbi:MAG: hypothetical protein ACRD1T_04110 [Acidimicrobiia bacterium]
MRTMLEYERLPSPTVEPGGDVRSAVLAWTDEWIGSAALRDLLWAFGGPAPALSRGSLDEIVEFSSRHWDFRGGRERNVARSIEFDSSTTAQVLASAEALGLRTPLPPQRQQYEYVLILGGLVRACILRPRFAASLISSGLQVREVVGLGGFRPLGGDEPELARACGLATVDNEVAAMEVGLRRAFDLQDVVTEEGHTDIANPNSSWLVRTFRGNDNLLIRLLAAPSGAPAGRRANTADTYEFWAHSVARVSARDRLLIVTSSIYVPYQGLEAIRMLAGCYGCGVETVGIEGSEQDSPALRQTFAASNYLQEVNSTLHAAQRIRALFQSS